MLLLLALFSISSVLSYPVSNGEQLVLDNYRTFKTTREFLAFVDHALSAADTKSQEATWAYDTNITDENQILSTKGSLEYNMVVNDLISQSYKYPPSNDDEERLLSRLKSMNDGVPKSEENQKLLSETLAKLTSIYSTERYKGMALEPDLTELLATSRDYDVLLDAYIGWRNVTGPKMKKTYEEFVNLYNIGARDSSFSDASDFWRSGYDMQPSEFTQMIEKIWDQVLPLYEQMHCYAGQKLAQKYGPERVLFDDGLLPSHLFGNMWSQDWININDILSPFPDVDPIDITPQLKKQGYDDHRMHKLAEDFYVSLGYDKLPDTFWKKSMFVKPADREVVCHASAWDFNNNDLRIKMCTAVNGMDMQTIHHEQGHLFYDHYYRNQPKLYREGAADFFHEAIGDTIVLSFVVPKHLQEIGLLEASKMDAHSTVSDEYKQMLNAQMAVALSKIAVLPWSYLIDLWRWKVFEGETKPEDYQSAWLALVEKYQGFKRMTESSTEDFDAGAKYHVASNTPYIRYFGAAVLQFQFYESLCKASGHVGPMHECSFYKSKEAGDTFKKMLSMGRSKVWPEAIRVATGGESDSLDASSLLKYFSPLMEYLSGQNKGKMCGWGKNRRMF